MYTTSVRRVDGAVVLSVPADLAEQLHLTVGETMAVAVDGDRLVMERSPRVRYNLDEVLSGYEMSEPQSAEDQEWESSPAVGRELI